METQLAHLCGVILDMDGTLIDSNEAHVASWEQALNDHGYAISAERIRQLIGMGGDNLLPSAIGVEKDTDLGKRISERRSRIFKEQYLPKLQAFPDVLKLLKRMRSGGLKLIVASSGEPEEVKRSLEIAGATDLVEDTTSSGDAESSKPDPDIVQAALRKLGCPPEQVIMLGDTQYDIEAAGKVGVRVVAFRCGGRPDHELTGAFQIYDDPADLLAQYEQSPFADQAAVR
ncbi:MAG: HAD family hydrolase [Anaerolineae bacterium]|nr:HAD family hydrolase [Anaerolineae bacterium]